MLYASDDTDKSPCIEPLALLLNERARLPGGGERQSIPQSQGT